MTTYNGPLRVIISGGGTGGHIFPALSIAQALKRRCSGTEILFVGAEGRMEMEKIPAAGFRIVGLNIAGLARGLSFNSLKSNLSLPFKLASSLRKASRTIREFKPDIAVGVGGYASAPLLYAAQRKGIPTLIQEQNGFAGLANRILGRKARAICVAYDNMGRFFPPEVTIKTGNPIRENIACGKRTEDGMKHLMITGGSLGCRTFNESMKAWIAGGCPGAHNLSVLWQCGRYYKEGVDAFMKENCGRIPPDCRIEHTDFIAGMPDAYANADLVISRSGASSVSELCAVGKAVVFVPSPNVAEDHQMHNAMALADKGAAVIIRDDEAGEKLLGKAMEMLSDDTARKDLEDRIRSLAIPDSADRIVDCIYKVLE